MAVALKSSRETLDNLKRVCVCVCELQKSFTFLFAGLPQGLPAVSLWNLQPQLPLCDVQCTVIFMS
jgi:hypothetical protein